MRLKYGLASTVALLVGCASGPALQPTWIDAPAESLATTPIGLLAASTGADAPEAPVEQEEISFLGVGIMAGIVADTDTNSYPVISFWGPGHSASSVLGLNVEVAFGPISKVARVEGLYSFMDEGESPLDSFIPYVGLGYGREIYDEPDADGEEGKTVMPVFAGFMWPIGGPVIMDLRVTVFAGSEDLTVANTLRVGFKL